MYVIREPGSLRIPPVLELSWPRRRWVTKGYRDGHGHWHIDWMPLGFELINWEENGDWSLHISAIIARAFVRLPLPRRQPVEQISDGWGFDLFLHDAHFRWGGHVKIVEWPWAWTHHETLWLLDSGKWWREPDGPESIQLRDQQPLFTAQAPYRYRLENGELQSRVATVRVTQRTWRRRWLPFLMKTRFYIDVRFDGEVGEETGSWKGGVVGTSFEIEPDESPIEALRRMERERSF